MQTNNLSVPSRPLLGLNILNIVGQATNRFVYADVFFIPLSSVVVTHFILNLRQVIYDAPNGSTATQPSVLSFVDRQLDLQASDLRFASFVDNIGHMLEQDDNVPTPGLETDVEDRGRGYTPITDIHGVSERL
ncbi:hypothetical protein CERSUDRAFT_98201 [Gelatoporia subvermispora B]|uniref:Uncharacterized protein n=1 Tax=Ceriporiopsis subvermispora (strain B) TaxID=914234 RepID=M2Q9S5_CERS8|nr:hypothetical protein CERSUDRAFT_98201 [Gelatoporia subvermispora B]